MMMSFRFTPRPNSLTPAPVDGDIQVFSGPDADHLALCGSFCLRYEEWHEMTRMLLLDAWTGERTAHDGVEHLDMQSCKYHVAPPTEHEPRLPKSGHGVSRGGPKKVMRLGDNYEHLEDA